MARTSRQEWAKRVERWCDSGLTAKEFAAETGVNASTLSYWKWKLAADARDAKGSARNAKPRRSTRRRSRASSGAPTFVEVTTTAAASEPLEFILPGDLRLRVPAGFDEDTLVRALRAVGART